jgi:hypothetical protein
VTTTAALRTHAISAAPAASLSAAQRNHALDFTKGMLVLIMVLYHWFNYFVALESEIYRYLRFLTPSFIFITGFLVSNVYLPKYRAGHSGVSRRLIERGGRVLLLFTALNIGASLAVGRNYNGAEMGIWTFIDNAYAVYITGNGRAAFDVPVPIGYFLLLAPCLLMATSRFALIPHAVAGTVFVAVLVASSRGMTTGNLELLAIGVFGMTAGTVPFVTINEALRRPSLIVVAYAGYLIAITVWNVRFFLQVGGVCLSLMLIYLMGVRLGANGGGQRLIIELGKYSLFAYIAQVVLLQMLRRAIGGVELHEIGLLLSLTASLVLTTLSVELLSAARARSVTVDRLYRAIFA